MSNHFAYMNERGKINTGCCGDGGSFFLSENARKQLALPLNIDELIDAVIKNAHEGEKNTPHQQRALIQEQYAQFRDAVKTGFGATSVQLEYGTPNQEMAKNLQYNVGLFSAFKTHDMLKEVVSKIRDTSGNLKGYSQFRKDALSVIGQYRESWLQTEYNTGVRSCRIAAQWAKYVQAKHLYPNLKYTLSRSAERRVAHEQLVGTILPIDHPFWDTHMPPLDWECKCGITNTDEQPTEQPPTVEVPEMFAFNPGKEGKVFDVDAHPYGQTPKKQYQDVAKQAWGALCSYERKQIVTQAREGGKMEKKIKVPGLAAPVQLNRNTYEKNLEFGPYFFPKLSILENIESILEDSQVIMVENRKPKQHVKQYHVLQHTTAAGNRINLHVEERKTGEMYLYYLHIQK